MNFAPVYLLYRFGYRIIEFLRHWYIKSVRMYWNYIFNKLEELDYYFAWRITLHHLFEPLYRDYSVIGYILGFIFRVLRLLFASIIYFLIFGLAVAGYVAWLFVLPYFVYKFLKG